MAAFAAAAWFLNHGEKPVDTTVDAADVGDCVQKTGSGDDVSLTVVECAGSKAEYKVAIRNPTGDRCPDGFSEYERTKGSVTTLRLCLTPVRR
ncbi:hypothetical protein [Streptomyces sp. NPDC020742]|uniref:LppU/SCO3897 family protein n=1 Tax=unclassified Streptomyces TaxID=2593676 RepID=UPI0033DE8199